MNAIMTGFIYLFIYEKIASADARKEKTISFLIWLRDTEIFSHILSQW